MATNPRLKVELTLNTGTIFVGSGGVEKWVSLVGGYCFVQDTVAAKPRINWNGLYFDGNDNISMGMNPSLNWESGEFTVEVWADTLPYLAFSQNGTGSSALVMFGTNGLYMSSDGATWGVSGLSIGSASSVMTHYAVVRDGTTIRTYQGGVQVASITYAAAMYYNSGNTFTIGRYLGSSAITGTMADFRLYHTCLYRGGVAFVPPPCSRYESLPLPSLPLAFITTALVNQFDSGD